MATLQVFTAAGDGDVNVTTMAADWTWAKNRDGTNGTLQADYTSTVTDGNGYFGVGTWCDGNNRPTTSRMFLPYDTSALGSGATVSAATIQLVPDYHSRATYSNYKQQITEGTQASTSTLATTDYNAWNDTVWADGIANDSLTNAAYNDWALNATGYGAINKTGYTKFCLRVEWDVANSPPATSTQNHRCGAGYRTSEYAGTSSDPSITITYTVAAGPVNMKTRNGLASASVKTVNALVIASIKTLDGLT